MRILANFVFQHWYLRLSAEPCRAGFHWGSRLKLHISEAWSHGFCGLMDLYSIWIFPFINFIFCSVFSYSFFRHKKMSLATSRKPRLSKPGPSIADLSNTAPPATASHCAAQATAAAETEWQIQAGFFVQTAAEGSPFITPPPETPISPTNSTGNNQPLPSIEEELVDKLDNLRDKSARRSDLKKTKRAHDVNGKSYCYIYLIYLIHFRSQFTSLNLF